MELVADVTQNVILNEPSQCERPNCASGRTIPAGEPVYFIVIQTSARSLKVCHACFEYYQNKQGTVMRPTSRTTRESRDAFQATQRRFNQSDQIPRRVENGSSSGWGEQNEANEPQIHLPAHQVQAIRKNNSRAQRLEPNRPPVVAISQQAMRVSSSNPFDRTSNGLEVSSSAAVGYYNPNVNAASTSWYPHPSPATGPLVFAPGPPAIGYSASHHLYPEVKRQNAKKAYAARSAQHDPITD